MGHQGDWKNEQSIGVAPDGSPVSLYLALRGDDEAALIHEAVPRGAAILELGCGVGRVTRHLVAVGHPVTAVDNSSDMLAHLEAQQRVETLLSDIATLDLSPRRWPVVVLASHMINHDLGPDFLAAAARHVTEDGCVLVERHPPGWVDVAEPTRTDRDGVKIAICGIERPGPGCLRATMIYDVVGRRYEQPFTAYEVDDRRLVELAANVGLRIDAFPRRAADMGTTRPWLDGGRTATRRDTPCTTSSVRRSVAPRVQRRHRQFGHYAHRDEGVLHGSREAGRRKHRGRMPPSCRSRSGRRWGTGARRRALSLSRLLEASS